MDKLMEHKPWVKWSAAKREFAAMRLKNTIDPKVLSHFAIYYTDIISLLPNNGKIIFLSRRGYELFKLLVNSGLINADSIKGQYVTDRYIHKLTDKQLDSFLANCGELIISDDSLVDGYSIKKVRKRIKNIANKNIKLKYAIPMVSEHYGETSDNVISDILNPKSFPLADINRFTIDFMDVSHRIGLYFVMDLPVFHCRVPLDGQSGIERIAEIVNAAYECENLNIKKAVEMAKAVEAEEDYYTNQYAFLPRAQQFASDSGAWFHEGVRCYFPEEKNVCDGHFRFDFIPSALFSAIKCSKAVEFVCLVSGKDNVISNRVSGQLDKRDREYLHRIVVLFVASAVGKAFVSSLQGCEVEMDYHEMACHNPQPVIELFESLYSRGDYVELVKKAFIASGIGDGIPQNEIIDAYNIGQKRVENPKQMPTFEDLVSETRLVRSAYENNNDRSERKGVKVVRAMCESVRIVKNTQRGWFLPIEFWLKEFGREKTGLSILVVTGSSISSFKVIYCPEKDLLIKAVSPGEGTLAALIENAARAVCAAVQHYSSLLGADYAKSINHLALAMNKYFKDYGIWQGEDRNLRFDLWKQTSIENPHNLEKIWGEETTTEYTPSDEEKVKHARGFTILYTKYIDKAKHLKPEIVSDAFAVVLQSDEPRKSVHGKFNEAYNRVYPGGKQGKGIKQISEFLDELGNVPEFAITT